MFKHSFQSFTKCFSYLDCTKVGHKWHYFGVFIVNLEHNLHLVLVFLSGAPEKIFYPGRDTITGKDFALLKYAHDSVDDSHFATCFYLLHNMLIR